MLLEVVEWLRARQARLRKYGLAVALFAFSAGLVLALRSVDFLRIRPSILLAYALFIPPVNFFLQSADLKLAARAGGASLTWKQSLEIVIYSRAATLLPIPGGMITRVAALKAKGLTTARSSMIVLLFTGILGTVAFAYAGVWLLRESVLGAGFLSIAAVGVLVCTGIARRASIDVTVIAQGIALRIAALVFETLALLVAFAAIGVTVRADQTAVLVVSGFVGLVVNVVPAGIGVREGVIAGLSPLVGIDPATGFLAASVERCVGMFWLMMLSVAIMVRRKA